MIRFLARRLFEAIAVLAVMSFVIYCLIGLMPGDPIDCHGEDWVKVKPKKYKPKPKSK